MAELTSKQVKALYEEFDIFCYRPTFNVEESNKNYVFDSLADVIWYAQSFEEPAAVYLDVLQQLRPSFLGGLPMCFDAWDLLKKLADGSLEIFFEDDNLDCFTVYGDNEDD